MKNIIKKIGMAGLGLAMFGNVAGCKLERSPYQELKGAGSYGKFVKDVREAERIKDELIKDYSCYNPKDIASNFEKENQYSKFEEDVWTKINVPIYEICPETKIPAEQKEIKGISRSI